MIKLYGSLARKFRKRFPNVDPKNINIKVKSAAELMRAMNSQFPGFKQMIRKKGGYKVVRGESVMDDKKALSKDMLTIPFHTKEDITWNIMPVAVGAGGKGGLLMTILGAVLVAIGIVATVAGWQIGGWAWGPTVIGLGLSMMAGGIAQMLTPVPEIPKSSREETPSYLFNGAVNIDEPGVTVPVAYGEVFVGSVVTSFGIKTEYIA